MNEVIYECRCKIISVYIDRKYSLYVFTWSLGQQLRPMFIVQIFLIISYVIFRPLFALAMTNETTICFCYYLQLKSNEQNRNLFSNLILISEVIKQKKKKIVRPEQHPFIYINFQFQQTNWKSKNNCSLIFSLCSIVGTIWETLIIHFRVRKSQNRNDFSSQFRILQSARGVSKKNSKNCARVLPLGVTSILSYFLFRFVDNISTKFRKVKTVTVRSPLRVMSTKYVPKNVG